MITFMDSKGKLKETEKYLDSQLWHLCAGSMIQMPTVNSNVFYFPQGHLESVNIESRDRLRIPASIPCRVTAVKFMADSETDEVFAKIGLLPCAGNEVDENEVEIQEKPTSFAKNLTQSDANNGGGFSVPRHCAETIFPALDYTADPPVQTILAKDVHGEIWKFRHIFRGSPKRHLLTTGWSAFVNSKKLVADDLVVFLKTENDDICVGIRRAKREKRGGPESSPGWNPTGDNCLVPYGSSLLREDGSFLSRNGNVNANGSFISRGGVKAEGVIEAATLAASGQPFEVVYHPRANKPEFCVKASAVKTAMQIRWYPGMRFKMAFETKNYSCISWFMGTVSSVQDVDPIRWPDSPWMRLQVSWDDESDLLKEVKRVNPWQVELVSNMPTIPFSSFSPPHKKTRLSHYPECPFDDQILFPGSSSNNILKSNNPFRCLMDNIPAGMQGARHVQYSLPDLDVSKLQSSLFPVNFSHIDRVYMPSRISNLVVPKPTNNENISCPTQEPNESKASFKLLGQTIHTEKKILKNCSSDIIVSPVLAINDSSDGNADKMGNSYDGSGFAFNQNSDPERF